jgi:hypothetical protein
MAALNALKATKIPMSWMEMFLKMKRIVTKEFTGIPKD